MARRRTITPAEAVCAAAIALYGERWQSPLSRSSGVSQSLLALIASGNRALTPDVAGKIADALFRELGRIQDAAQLVERLIPVIDNPGKE